MAKNEEVYLYKSSLRSNQGLRDWNFFILTETQAKKFKYPLPPVGFKGLTPKERRGQGNVKKNTHYVEVHEIPEIFLDEEGNPRKKFNKEPYQLKEFRKNGSKSSNSTSVPADLKKKEQDNLNLEKKLKADQAKLENERAEFEAEKARLEAEKEALKNGLNIQDMPPSLDKNS